MRNYFKVSFWFTLAVVTVFLLLELIYPWGKTDVGSASAIFPALTVAIFFYALVDLFLFSHDRSEVDGVYRHIPMLVTALSISLCGMILSSRIFSNEGTVWLWVNFFLFCVSTVFVARTVVSTINNSYHVHRAYSPFSRDEEITDLFWKTLLQLIATCAIILAICHFI